MTEKSKAVREPSVWCGECKEWLPNFIFIDISEDFEGRDVCKFRCLHCGTISESLVR